MAESPTEYYIKQVEKEKGIKLPICIFNKKGLKALDKVLRSKSPMLIHRFYKNFRQYYDLKSIDFLTETLKKRRNVSKTDKELIKNIVQIKRKDSGYFFETIGNQFYLAELVDEMIKKKDKLSRVIHISLLLFIYINMIEITTKVIAGFVLEYLKKEKLQKEKKYEYFVKGFKDNEHPTIGQTIQILEQLDFLKDRKDSVFGSGKLVRNRISHANMYYDKSKHRIIVSNGTEYYIREFKKEFRLLSQFLDELLYHLNGKNNDLKETLEKSMNAIANVFLKIERSGNIKKQFQSIKFDWE